MAVVKSWEITWSVTLGKIYHNIGHQLIALEHPHRTGPANRRSRRSIAQAPLIRITTLARRCTAAPELWACLWRSFSTPS